MTGVLQMLLAGFGGAATDEYFEYVTMLLPGNGTNGAQNNTFLDSSTNNFTITRNGNTTQGTFTPYGSNWSNYFDGNGDYLSSPNNAAIHVLGSDFCLEGWFFLTAAQGDNGLYSTYTSVGGNDSGYIVRLTSTAIRFAAGTGSGFATATDRSYSFTVGQWYHFAVTNSGTTARIFINGVQQGATFSTSGYANSSSDLWIGRVHTTTNDFPGYLSNFRVVKGSAIYTSNFTPSTAPLTAITNTSLLTCQSNRFIDNSSNNFTITRNGDVSVQRFSPFNPTTPYAAGTIGGSGYFDGSGDYLNGPTTGQFAPTGDFTISMWFYPTSFAASYYVLAGSWNAGASDEWLIQYDNTGAIRFLTTTDSTFSAAGVVKLNQWQFLSISRSGSTVTGYINGTSFRSYTLTGTVGSATKTVYVGIQAGTTWPYVGYISDYRLVAGSAQSATPPTAPATAISGTNTLLNFTNGGIIDNAMMNDLETVGNAQISTSVSKFGGGSMAFDGTGDWLFAISRATTSLEGDFTIEGWAYLSSTAAAWPFITIGDSSGSSGIELYRATSNGKWRVYSNNTAQIDSATSTGTGSWVHLAVVRSSGVVKLYVNGTNEGSTWSTTSTFSGAVYVAAEFNGGSVTVSANGYIDDLRITKYARYTANFTPPTQAFPTQ